MLANAETKWAVLKAFNALIDHIANGRLNETMACFSDHADVAFFGSEVGETAIGPEAVRTQFTAIYAQPFRVLFDLQPGKVSTQSNVAWLTADGTYRLSTDGERQPYRLTALMVRKEHHWLWQVFSGSEPR
ncbi:MAG: nuclear transport factor 2 family protein [Bauldia sp.]